MNAGNPSSRGSAFEDAVRTMLRDHATPVVDPSHLLEEVRRGARTRRRRQLVGAGMAGAAVVALAVAIPLGVGQSDRNSILPAVSPPAQPPAVPSPVPTATFPQPSATTGTVPDDVFSWVLRGDGRVRAELEPRAQAAIVAKHPGAVVTGLWAGTTPSGGWTGYVFRASVPNQPARLGVFTARTDGSPGSLIRDDVLLPGTIEIDQQLPADPTNMLVVLGPPSTTEVRYLTNTNALNAPKPEVRDGVAFFAIPGIEHSTPAFVQLTAGSSSSPTAIYQAPLSAGGFVLLSGKPSSSRELVANGLLQAWLSEDRGGAAQYADPSAITQLFARDPVATRLVGGACSTGAVPAYCFFTTPDGSADGLVFRLDGGVSAGYQVVQVAIQGTIPPSAGSEP